MRALLDTQIVLWALTKDPADRIQRAICLTLHLEVSGGVIRPSISGFA